MNKKITVYSAVLTVVFAAVGCLGDSIEALYSTCMVLCIASLLVFIVGLIRLEYAPEKKEAVRVIAKEKESLKRTA